MFGEDLIIGQSILKKDEKNRITLPAFTYASYGDVLAFLKTGINSFDIITLEVLKDYLLHINSQKELIHDNIVRDIIYKTLEEITDNSLGYRTVDRTNRVVIPNFNASFSSFDSSDILLVGKMYDEEVYGVRCKILKKHQFKTSI